MDKETVENALEVRDFMRKMTLLRLCELQGSEALARYEAGEFNV